MDKPAVVQTEALLMPHWKVPAMNVAAGEDAEHYVRRVLAEGVGYAVACWAVRGEGMLQTNATQLAMTMGDWVSCLVETAYCGGVRMKVSEISDAYSNGVDDGAAFARRGMAGEQ